MDNINLYAQLQALSSLNDDSTVVSSRKQLNEIVSIFKQREEYLEEVTWFADLARNLKVETLLECDSFMLQPYIPVTLLKMLKEMLWDFVVTISSLKPNILTH